MIKTVEIHQKCKDCHGDLLACDKERYSGASISLSPWSKFPLNWRWGARGVDELKKGGGFPTLQPTSGRGGALWAPPAGSRRSHGENFFRAF